MKSRHRNIAVKNNPKLWKRSVREACAEARLCKHSARKMQWATKRYKSLGGGTREENLLKTPCLNGQKRNGITLTKRINRNLFDQEVDIYRKAFVENYRRVKRGKQICGRELRPGEENRKHHTDHVLGN